MNKKLYLLITTLLCFGATHAQEPTAHAQLAEQLQPFNIEPSKKLPDHCVSVRQQCLRCWQIIPNTRRVCNSPLTSLACSGEEG